MKAKEHGYDQTNLGQGSDYRLLAEAVGNIEVDFVLVLVWYYAGFEILRVTVVTRIRSKCTLERESPP